MEILRSHLKYLERISDGLKTASSYSFLPAIEGEFHDFQPEAQILIALDRYGYINAKPLKTQAGVGAVAVYGLTDLGRKTLQDPMTRLKIDLKEQEQALGQIYLMASNEEEILTHASFQLFAIAERLHIGMEEAEKALTILVNQGLLSKKVKRESDFSPGEVPGEVHYSLSIKGEDAVLRLAEGRSFRQVIMGDQYNISGQAGAAGPNARAEGNTFQQIQQQEAVVDPAVLVRELGLLLEKIEVYSDDPEKEEDVASIKLACKSAERGDSPKALERLAKVGSWVVDFAIQTGAAFTAEYLKKVAGL